MDAHTQEQVVSERPQGVINLDAHIIAEEQAMTIEQKTARWLRLEVESERHGAFARIW